MPVSLTALILTRDVALVVAGFYVRYVSLVPQVSKVCQCVVRHFIVFKVTLSNFFDLSYATVEVKPTLISKVC
jgi:cardiolipin synthase